MSELDLGLKVGARSLLWSMGYSTRVDVELRGDPRAASAPRDATARRRDGRPSDAATPPSRSRPGKGGPETFTDLDVLGVRPGPGFRVSTIIADCKSGHRDRPTARMFWARGVADLFGADDVMLVREHDVNDAARQLSGRLGITVLASADLGTMQGLYGPPIADPTGPLSILFDRDAVSAHFDAFTGLDRRLNPLMEYREFDYWVYEPHRNPIQLVSHLRDARRHLDPQHPIHLAVFADLAWLYTAALIRVCAHVSGALLGDVDRGIQEYLFGGAINLREKQEVANLLRSVAPNGTAPLDHLPPYYGALRELVTRMLRRPNELGCALQYAEAASALMAARMRVPLSHAFGASFRPVAAKLVADVCGFLVAAAELNPQFRAQARAWLLAEPLGPHDDTSAQPHRQGPPEGARPLPAVWAQPPLDVTEPARTQPREEGDRTAHATDSE